MFNILRKIRRSLIESGSARKYVLYAIGEILLVMIGILLALQVNNWNERKKINTEEHNLISSLLEEFKYNKEETERSIQVAQMIQEKCMVLIQNTGDKSVKITKRESDSLIFSGLTRIISLDFSEGILTTLLSTGKIQIIKNDSLRNMLSNWPSLLRDVKEDEGWAIDQRNNFILPYLNKHYSSITEFNDIKSGFSIPYTEIYQFLEFENIVDNYRRFNRANERNYTYLLSAINDVIRICELELP